MQDTAKSIGNPARTMKYFYKTQLFATRRTYTPGKPAGALRTAIFPFLTHTTMKKSRPTNKFTAQGANFASNHKSTESMGTNNLDGINTLRYSDIFLAMFFNDGQSCLHRNHSHVLVYMYSGELVINERDKVTRLHKGDCAFIRKDFCVRLTKHAYKGGQFKAIFLMFTSAFLHDFYNGMDKSKLPDKARRAKVSLCKLPSNRPDIVSLFESMVPYFNSEIQPTEELLRLKMAEGVYVLLNTNRSLYASLFDFVDPWKIDILDFLEKNYINDLTLDEIANYTGRSLATFKRDFKKVSDLPPQKWIIRRRLKAAHELILSGKRKVTEVCYDVGFKNLSHFSKAYKGLYGVSPSNTSGGNAATAAAV